MRVSTIDTRHGTANQHSFSHGNCLPYTGVPFGMNYFAPQTSDQRGSWWFHPEDRTFQGFRITHQPSPWMGDFSHFILLPIAGVLSQPSLYHAQSSYRPEESCFNPAYLEITSCRYQIKSRMIPSMYGGQLSMENIQKDGGLAGFFPGCYDLIQLDPQTIQGKICNFSGCEDAHFTFYFILRFKKELTRIEGSLNGEDGFVVFRFGDTPSQILQLGTSFLSAEQAALNLEREKEWQQEDYLANSQTAWEDYLGRIDVCHKNPIYVSTFYHNLYRTFLFPQTFYEIDGNGDKLHYDTLNKKISHGPLYTNNGFWDTYKTVYPLFSLIAKEKYAEMLEGFLNSYKETGFLPKWLSPDERGLMPGTLIDAVIADAAVKNIRPDLMLEFLEAMKKAATSQSKNSNYGRQGTLDYLKYGYVPSHYHESVNHTLDYCYSDFCIYQVAKHLADEEVSLYKARAKNYQNIFDKKTGFMRAKDAMGQFSSEFDDLSWGKDYAEGSAWQSSFAVYHDFAGLIDLYGGKKSFEEKLVALCNQPSAFSVTGYGCEIHEMSEMAALDFGQLAISNQPSFHYPYLFSYLGKPEMSQPLIKQLLTQCFDDSPQGYPGDEDNGSMAGWYIFNALGFYPVTPGTGEYVIGMPLVDTAILHLSSGHKLKISSNPNAPQQQFIHQVTRNEETYKKLFFQHKDLETGGSIHFDLGIVPNKKNYEKNALPYSLRS